MKEHKRGKLINVKYHNISSKKSLRKQQQKNVFNLKANVLSIWALLRGNSKFIKLLNQQGLIIHP